MREKLTVRIRMLMHTVISNQALFVFAAFVTYGVLIMKPLAIYREMVRQIEMYVIVPWGAALCLLRLERSAQRAYAGSRWDLNTLFVLLLWIIVPFGLRFGLTANNVYSWHSNMVVFFGIYALTSETGRAEREQMLDLISVLFAALSFVLGGALLYCAATVQTYWEFGIVSGQQLCAGMHHNSTGILALCCTIMSALGFFRRRHIAARLAHLIPSVMMGIVVVLSQSRTSRYCLLAALALGCYGVIADRARIQSHFVRHLAGLLAGVLVFAGGYTVMAKLTDAALVHYASEQMELGLIASAKAEEEQKAEHEQSGLSTQNIQVKKARGAGDASFTGRTLIWKNVFELFKETPKYFVIGYGVGRTAKLIIEGTLVESSGASTTHNAYLQYVADFGIIGFILLAAFLCLVLPSCLRVFFARGAHSAPGYRVLCGMVVAALLTGMMESVTFNAMTPMNMTLFFALALIVGRDRDLQSLV